MSNIDKEWLKQKIADMEAARDEIPFGLNEDDSNTLAAMKLALASLEAEAAGYMNRFTGRVFTLEEQPGADTDVQVYVPVYTAPPGPVSVPDEREAFNSWNNDTDCPLVGRDAKTAAWLAWCRRAAMLQGADGNAPMIPDGWVACSERMPDPDNAFRVCAYTPTPHEDVRFRFVPASLFKSVCRDATHWQYMLPPAAPQQ